MTFDLGGRKEMKEIAAVPFWSFISVAFFIESLQALFILRTNGIELAER